MKPGRVLILGNGGAALAAMESARRSGYHGPVVAVSPTSGPSFNPMLAPYFLAGQMLYEDCFPFGQSFYEKHGVECLFGSPVEALDALNREIVLQNGERLHYDSCLVATGASPVLPKVPGLEGSNRVLKLRTAEDTLRLDQALGSAHDIVILGASRIGLKLSEIALKRGTRVKLIDLAEQILPLSAHPECALVLKQELERAGVDIYLGWKLKAAEENKKGLHLYFENQRSLDADFCLVCIGVAPNLGFLNESQVDIDKGIIVDDRMKTSADGLYAAGDVAQGMNLLSGRKEVIGLWGNARNQGRTAGINMVGGEWFFPGGISQQVSTFFGHSFVSLGDVSARGENVRVLTLRDPSGVGFCLFIFDEGVLVGANLIDKLHYAGKLKSAILARFDWSDSISNREEMPEELELDQILARFYLW